MTVRRVMFLALLGMLATGMVVYSLTTPIARPLDVPAETPTASSSGPDPAPSGEPSAVVPPSALPTPSRSTRPPTTPAPSAPHPSSTPGSDASDRTLALAQLAALAAIEAAGMHPEGSPLSGRVTGSGTVEQGFTLIPGKCYAALVVGVGVSDFEARLLLAASAPATPVVLTTGRSVGARAAVGGKGNCYKWAAPLQASARFSVSAYRGTGLVVGQLYVK